MLTLPGLAMLMLPLADFLALAGQLTAARVGGCRFPRAQDLRGVGGDSRTCEGLGGTLSAGGITRETRQKKCCASTFYSFYMHVHPSAMGTRRPVRYALELIGCSAVSTHVWALGHAPRIVCRGLQLYPISKPASMNFKSGGHLDMAMPLWHRTHCYPWS